MMNRYICPAKAVFLILLTLGSFSLYGGGKEELPLYTMDDAERLIEERDYNQAIEILITLSKQDPELFEQAQEKIRFIRSIRNSYNDTYDQLIQVLFVDEDYEKALELIKELEALDSNPNEATRLAIRDARISAELVYYKKIFNQIMDQALVFLADGRYQQAIKLYETGFELFRQTFDESSYGDLLKDPVYRAYDDLTNTLAQLEEGWDDFLFTDENSIALAFGNEELYNKTLENFSLLSEMRNRIYQVSVVYDRSNQLVIEGNQGVEDFHLSFMHKLITGRLTSGEWEGITVALDYYIEQNFDKVRDVYNSQITNSMNLALNQYDQADWANVEISLADTVLLNEELNLFYNINLDRVYLDPSRDIDRLGKRIVDKYYDGYRENRNIIYQVDAYSSLIVQQAEMDQIEEQFRAGQRSDYPTQRISSVDVQESLIPVNEQLQILEENLALDPLLTSQTFASLDRAKLDQNSSYKRAEALEGDIVVAMADWDIRNPESLLKEYETRLALDSEYISGFGKGDANEILLRYPQRALSDLGLLTEQISSLVIEARQYKNIYQGEQQEIYDGTLLAEYIERIDSLLNRSGIFSQQVVLLQEDGENFVYLAQKDYNAGEFRFAQAERQLNNSNFQLARDELSKAQDLYVSALSYDEDSFSRDDLDSRIAALQARIVDEENKKVIRDVRELITQGKTLYFQGLYAQSETRLIQAENKWFTTNTEENSELVYWMSLVRTALSVESGRYLEESNPLYNEISQLLNLAWKNYEEGQNNLRDNRRVEGINSFNRGDEFLNQVLILMPLNQNASVLKLRILRALDEDNFSITFADKYRNALQKMEFQEEQAYIDLTDLAEIIPDYPGIQSNILKLEYSLGIKIPPPDPAKLRESQRLYASAQAIFDSGNLNLFSGAIEQLSEAISLNPDNSAASQLIDQMRLYEGGQSTVVLPSAALSLYQNAEEKFVSGEYLGSYQIIQELWKNRDYQAYPPLQELKRRVEAKLGL